jgi:uncharacterized protein YbaR (Trm112 family)
MTSLNTQLQYLRDEQSDRINGVVVCRKGSQYIIDGVGLTLEKAIEALKKQKKLTYDQIVFLLVKPPGRAVSSHQIKSRKDHVALLEKAKEKKYVVYYADVERHGGKFFAVQPWILDTESVGSLRDLAKEESEPVEELENEAEIHCPFCNKKMSSTQGRTLHVKAKHPQRYEEYLAQK